jgi:hypothetical protein
MGRKRLVVAERVVKEHAEAQLQPLYGSPPCQRQKEWQRRNQMRRDAEQGLALAQIEADQPEVTGRQVAQSAMNQAGRRGRRAAAEIIALEQRNREATSGRVAGDAGPDDSTTDDDEIYLGDGRQPSHCLDNISTLGYGPV